jgi:hypothetical protein
MDQSHAQIPLLTPAVMRRMLGRSQMQIAVAAGVGVATVRIFEIEARAVTDPQKRSSLVRVYSAMRDEILTRPQ